MTVSFGFRAPTYRSMLTALTDHVCRTAIPEDLYYSDPSLQSQRSSPGLIDVSARDAVASKLREQVIISQLVVTLCHQIVWLEVEILTFCAPDINL